MNTISHNRGRLLPAEPLTADEARQLLRATGRRSPTGIRNGALLVVLWRAGLRISEALDLYPKDLDSDNGTIRVLEGKGRKARTVGMDVEAWAVVQRWLDKRQRVGLNGHQYLFCTLAGKRMSSAYVRAMLPRLARRAGIHKRVHAHGLRHTMAAELRQEGVEVGIISKQLGHSSIATTARYLDHVAPQSVIDTMRRRRFAS